MVRPTTLLGLLGFLAIGPALGACSAEPPKAEPRRPTRSHQFFQNATRRDPSAPEASRIAQLVTSECAAFFLETTSDRTLIATARHCVEFKIEEWCENDGAVRDSAGNEGHCTEVVVSDDHRDIAVFEADLAHARDGETTLRLAAYPPEVGARLVMTGFPADDEPSNPRRGRMTTIDNCWVLTGPVKSPYAEVDRDTLDPSAQHNCSTYGGNSGGPMVLEGTRDAIGLPFTYEPEDYAARSSTDLTTAAYLALSAGFTRKYRDALEEAGVVLADAPGVASTDGEESSGDEDDDEDGRGGRGESEDDALEDAEDTSTLESIPRRSEKDEETVEDGLKPLSGGASGCSAHGAPSRGGPGLAGIVVAALALGSLVRRRHARKAPIARQLAGNGELLSSSANGDREPWNRASPLPSRPLSFRCSSLVMRVRRSTFTPAPSTRASWFATTTGRTTL